MSSDFALDLTGKLRELLSRGMRLDPTAQRVVEQTLAVANPAELAAGLADCFDAEAWSMRDLVLFPDLELALSLEGWLVDQEALGRCADNAVARSAARGLVGAPARLLPVSGPAFELVLDQEEANRFVVLLRLDKALPAPIREALDCCPALPRNDQILLEARMLCKKVLAKWTPERTAFVRALILGCLGNPDGAASKLELPALLDWTLNFLATVQEDEDAVTALIKRREQLMRQLGMAQEMERLRTLHNFEIRRMLGIVELSVDMAALRSETELLDKVAAAAGREVAARSEMERDLGVAGSVRHAASLLD